MKKKCVALILAVAAVSLAVTGCNSQNKQEDTTAKLSEDAAKAIAFADLGISGDDIAHISIYYENEDNEKKYSIEFYYNDMEYDYEIDAQTGDILTKESTTVGYDSQAVAEASLNAVAEDAAATMEEASARTAPAPASRSMENYDAQSSANSNQSAPVPELRESRAAAPAPAAETAPAPAATPAPATSQAPAPAPAPVPTNNTADIGLEQAKKIAIGAVPGSSAANIVKAKRDYEDDWGYYEYEIELVHDGMEYDFEIRATDGAIIKKDVESIYD